MTSRVIVGTNTPAGKMLLDFVSRQQEALQLGRRIKALLDDAQFGSPADWGSVATELGGGITAQNAQDAWTIVSNAMAAVDVPAVGELARLDQG